MGNLGNEWVVRVWVSEHRADREKDYKRVRRRCQIKHSGRTFGDGQGGTPLITQNVQADAAVRVDVGVVDTSCEVDLGRLEWVVGWEVDC
jgi:hypothetical protein